VTTLGLRSGLCYRNFVCRPSVVCNVRVPYSGGWNFRQYFVVILYLSHPLTCVQNYMEIVAPSIGGVKRKSDSEIERCHVRVSHLLMSFLFALVFVHGVLCDCNVSLDRPTGNRYRQRRAESTWLYDVNKDLVSHKMNTKQRIGGVWGDLQQPHRPQGRDGNEEKESLRRINSLTI